MSPTKKTLVALFGIVSAVFLVYLGRPQTPYPRPLWDFVASKEPADNETPLRRGYFTNLTRDQLMSHYQREFGGGLRLNYPPEEAQTLIRDQTHATFLEEIVHPMRESLFVTGNEPGPNDAVVVVDDKKFKQKVIIKYVGAGLTARLGVGVLVLALIWALGAEWLSEVKLPRWTSQ